MVTSMVTMGIDGGDIMDVNDRVTPVVYLHKRLRVAEPHP